MRLFVRSITMPSLQSYNFAVQIFTGDPNARIEVNSTGYPESDPRFVSNSVVSNGGAFWFYCPPMFTFMILVDQIVTEKEKKLRLGMRTMGLKVGCFCCDASSLIRFSGQRVLALVVFDILRLASSIYSHHVRFWRCIPVRCVISATRFAKCTDRSCSVLYEHEFRRKLHLVLPLRYLYGSACFLRLNFQLYYKDGQYATAAKLLSDNCADNVAFIIFIIGLLLQIIFSSFAIYIWWSDVRQYLSSICDLQCIDCVCRLAQNFHVLSSIQLCKVLRRHCTALVARF